MADDAVFIEAVRQRDSVSTQEVAETVGCTRRAADYRLRKLYAEGKIESKSVGNSLIWYIPKDIDIEA